MASTATTGALLREFCDARLSGTVEWRTGPGFCRPSAVYVVAGQG